MKKISILAAFALSAALIFSGCDTDAVTEAISELTSDTTTDETTDDTTTDAADETADEAEETTYSVDFTNSTIKDAYCGTYDGTDDIVAEDGTVIISVDSDGVLTMAGYCWDKTYITLADTVDLSSYTKVTITAKVAEDYTAGDAVILELSSDDEAASGVSSWTDSTFFGDLTTDYASFSIGMDQFSNLGDNSVYGSTVADMSAIKEICINPRGATGNIYIKSIIFE